MRTIVFKLSIIAVLSLALASCSSDGEVKNLGVTAVKTLYEPDDGKAIVLQSSASATLYFVW